MPSPAKKVSPERVAFTTLLIDIGDLIMLGITAAITGSVAMLAQLLQSGANIITDIFLMIGIRRSKHPKTHRHPFGYGRELYVWTMFSSILLFAGTTTLSFIIGWQRYMNPEAINNIVIALGILAVSLVSNSYGVWISAKRLCGEFDLPVRNLWRAYRDSSYVETKVAFITDFAGGLSAIIGLASLALFKWGGYERLDGLGAIAIGVVVGGLAFMQIIGIKDLLVGRGVSKDMDERIHKLVAAVRGVERVTDIATELLGDEQVMVDIDVQLDPTLSVAEAEEIFVEIKKILRAALPQVKRIQIELAQHNK